MPRQHPQRNCKGQLSLWLMRARPPFSLHAHTHTNMLRTFPTLRLVFTLRDFRWKGQGQTCGLPPEWARKERAREIDTVKEEGAFRQMKRRREGKRIFAIPAVQHWPARLPRRPLESWLEERCCNHRPRTCQMGVVEGGRVRKWKE